MANTGRNPSEVTDELIEKAREAVEGRLHGYRLIHSFNVADTAASLAEFYGVSINEARIAGLLHDWDKEYDDGGILARAEEMGIDLPDEMVDMGAVLHAQTGAIAVAELFPELPQRIINAIARHTTAAVNMTALDKIIFISDMIEPMRTKGTVDKIRALAGKATLDELFLEAFSATLIHLIRHKHLVAPGSLDVWNSLAGDYRAGLEEKA